MNPKQLQYTSIVAVGVFWVLVLFVGQLNDAHSVVAEQVSHFRNHRAGWLISVAILALGVAIAATSWILWLMLPNRRALQLMIASIFCTIIAAAFPLNPIDVAPSLIGTTHALSVGVGFGVGIVGLRLHNMDLFQLLNNQRANLLHRLWWAMVALLPVQIMGTAWLLPDIIQPFEFLEVAEFEAIAGLIERLLLLAFTAWLVLVSIWLGVADLSSAYEGADQPHSEE